MARSKKIKDGYNDPFPKRLRELMIQNGTTQDQLAEKIEKTRQTVSQYANGISEPGYDTLVKIADFFHVSTDYLLGRTLTKTADLTKQAIMEYTGLSEANVTSLHHMVENVQPILDMNTTDFFIYRDGCKPILACFNDLFDALMDDKKAAEKAVTYYVRIRQHSGHLGEYKDDSYYVGAKMDVFPGAHAEKESNIIVEHACSKIAEIIEQNLMKKYMGYYLNQSDDE